MGRVRLLLLCSAFVAVPFAQQSEGEAGESGKEPENTEVEHIAIRWMEQLDRQPDGSFICRLPEVPLLYCRVAGIVARSNSEALGAMWGNSGPVQQIEPLLSDYPKVFRPSQPIEIKPHQRNMVEWK